MIVHKMVLKRNEWNVDIQLIKTAYIAIRGEQCFLVWVGYI